MGFFEPCINEFKEKLGQFILENWSRFLNGCATLLNKTKVDPN